MTQQMRIGKRQKLICANFHLKTLQFPNFQLVDLSFDLLGSKVSLGAQLQNDFNTGGFVTAIITRMNDVKRPADKNAISKIAFWAWLI